MSHLLLTLKSNFEHALFGKSLRACLSVFYAKQSVTFIFLMEGFELYKLQTFFIRHFWPLLFCIDSMCLHGSMCVCIFTIICSKLMKGLVQKSHFCLKYVTFFSVNLNWSCVWLFMPRCFLLLFKISCECQFACI